MLKGVDTSILVPAIISSRRKDGNKHSKFKHLSAEAESTVTGGEVYILAELSSCKGKPFYFSFFSLILGALNLTQI